MQVDRALILAAGAGTRMGEIGKTLPKVLWPVFEKSLLELEVLSARSLGAKEIYINVHHYKEQLLEHLSSSEIFKDVTVLVEDDRLDIGGAVHNLCSKAGYKGRLLILNADQFIFMSEEQWALALQDRSDVLLFCHEVNSSDLYNGLVLDGGMLERVAPNSEFERNESILTYTGMSLVNLDKLEFSQGESRFFDSVANPSKLRVKCANIKNCAYWDFGTVSRYWESSFEVLSCLAQNKPDPFVLFLRDSGALHPEYAGQNNYRAQGENAINLSKYDIGPSRAKIVLPSAEPPSPKALKKSSATIVKGGVWEEV